MQKEDFEAALTYGPDDNRTTLSFSCSDSNVRSIIWCDENTPNAPRFIEACESVGMAIKAPPMPTTRPHNNNRATTIDLFTEGPGTTVGALSTIPSPNATGHHLPIVATIGIGKRTLIPNQARVVTPWSTLTEEHFALFTAKVSEHLARGTGPGPPDPEAADKLHARLLLAVRSAIACLPKKRFHAGSSSAAWSNPTAPRAKRNPSPYELWRLMDEGPISVEPPWELLEVAFAGVSRASTPTRAPPATPPAQPVTIEEVKTAILKHNLNGCADPDGITPRLLRLLPPNALELLAKLFDLASAGRVPRAWKDSVIVALPKPGPNRDYTLAGSWRPIALTSLISRTWERVVALRLEPSWPQPYKARSMVIVGAVQLPCSFAPSALNSPAL